MKKTRSFCYRTALQTCFSLRTCCRNRFWQIISGIQYVSGYFNVLCRKRSRHIANYDSLHVVEVRPVLTLLLGNFYWTLLKSCDWHKANTSSILKLIPLMPLNNFRLRHGKPFLWNDSLGHIFLDFTLKQPCVWDLILHLYWNRNRKKLPGYLLFLVTELCLLLTVVWVLPIFIPEELCYVTM